MKPPKRSRRAADANGLSGTPIDRIKEVLAKVGKPVQLAAAIGVSESRIYEYMAGKRQPTPEGWLALGRLALEYGLLDPFYFWARAGVDTQALRSMAAKVQKKQYEIAGATVPVPRFRPTESGMEEAGTPVPLPTEFLPSPATTICISVDKRSPSVGNSPRGLILLDTSVEGDRWRDDLSGKVVMLDYRPRDIGPWPLGLYMGRIMRRPGAQLPRAIWIDIIVETLSDSSLESPHVWMPVGVYVESAEALAAVSGDKEKSEAIVKEFQKRAASKLRLSEGVRILGKVIGRLTGHFEMEQAKGAGDGSGE